MNEIVESKVLSFECHTGHRYSIESLYEAQSEAVEKALWSALRLLKEKALAIEKIHKRQDLGHADNQEYFKDQYGQITEHIRILEELLGKPTHKDQLKVLKPKIKHAG